MSTFSGQRASILDRDRDVLAEKHKLVTGWEFID